MELKVSVIVAVYNVSTYIEQCLHSVYAQSLQGIELIVVNDGSTDDSLAIIKKVITERSAEHLVTQIISQENGGLSAARNKGALHARGRYLYFLDGDDWVEPDMLKEMYDHTDANQAEVAICDYRRSYSDRFEDVTGGHIPFLNKINEKRGLELFLDGKIVIAAWNKLFLTSFFRAYDFKFPLDVWFEDIPLTLLIVKAKTIVKLDKPFYNYRQREGSIMKTLSLKTLQKVHLVADIENYIKKKGYYKELYPNFQRFYCELIILQVINDTLKNGVEQRALRDEIIFTTLKSEKTREVLRGILRNNKISPKHKAGLLLLKYYPRLYIRIFERKYRQ